MQDDRQGFAPDWAVPDFTVAQYAPKRWAHALVIPVINEGERIRAQLLRVAAADLPVDVIVADGGSTDGSLDPEFVRGAGVGAVLTKTGSGRLSAQLRIAYAWCLARGYEGIVTIDGNGKDGVETVRTFVARLEAGDDYLQGSRYAPGGIAEHTPLERTIANRGIHAPLLSLASGYRYTDTTNGYRGYSARYLRDPRVAPFRAGFDRYELLFYLTARAGQLGYRTREIGVERRYPKGEATPTKITGLGPKLAVLGETFRAATGRYHPDGPWRGALASAWFMPLVVLIVAFLSYRLNLFGAVSQDLRGGFQADSDRLVYDALATGAAQLGTVEPGGFAPYFSQFGAQLYLYRALTWPLGSEATMVLIRSLNALALALVVAVVAGRSRAMFGRAGGWAVGLYLALAPGLIMFGTSAYWMAWTWFLPLAIALGGGDRLFSDPKVLRRVALLMFLAFLWKFLCGYEYASTIALATMAPVLFFGLRDQMPFRRIMLVGVTLGGAAVAGFAAALLLHAAQLSATSPRGTGEISALLQKRLYSPHPQAVAAQTCAEPRAEAPRDVCEQMMVRSLQASVPSVVARYLTFRRAVPWLATAEPRDGTDLAPLRAAIKARDPAAMSAAFGGLDAVRRTSLVTSTLSGLLVLIALTLAALRIGRGGRAMLPYAALLAVATAAPLSWFVLAKGHSYIHHRLNFVLWMLPFLPFLLGFLIGTRRRGQSEPGPA